MEPVPAQGESGHEAEIESEREVRAYDCDDDEQADSAGPGEALETRQIDNVHNPSLVGGNSS